MDIRTKCDFDTLNTERIAYAGLADLQAVQGSAERAEALARLILAVFDDYYLRSRRIPWLAKEAFEHRDWPTAIALSHERIAIYSVSIAKAVPVLELAIRETQGQAQFWPLVEAAFTRCLGHRYEADLALAYLASIRRWVYRDRWEPIPYDTMLDQRVPARLPFLAQWQPPEGRMTSDCAARLLAAPGLEAPFRDAPEDASAVAARINAELGLDAQPALTDVEVAGAGFYRNRGAYVVGALSVGGRLTPFALALLNGAEGIYVDAVILRSSTLRHVFSSALANFHVTEPAYHALCAFLFRLMPERPIGQHYSTVGYNHVGKMAVMQELQGDLDRSEDQLGHAPGPRGSVAIGFTAPGTEYVLKVIRDTPTENYKWERFDGVGPVLDKYRAVHELNRSGSMLDNILYQSVALPRALFGEALLEDLMEAASGTVALYRDEVVFRHLIVQRKMVPLPLFLERCTRAEAEMAVIRLGQCIRNNAATNVFNRDLDGRNYGVSALRFVYLFDYDAILPLSDVKVRTNTGREEGEEDIPDWFFEEGPVFLPEELEAHLHLPDKGLRRLFREAHGELLTATWWERMQRLLAEGRVPRVRTYPRAAQLDRARPEADLTLRTPR
ncbi:MAG: isocitrate dehydrogenase kinase/phosphatase AceK regulatory subunit [Pseudomonadota bacterium]